MYSTISYYTLIDYVHNTQPVLRIISSLLYMPDYECWLDSNCQMNLITLQQDDLKGRMCWLVLNTTSTHTYIHRYGLLWITNSSIINTYCVIPRLYNILYPLYTLSDCWYMIEWRREIISSSCLWIEYIENMIIITCLWMDEMPSKVHISHIPSPIVLISNLLLLIIVIIIIIGMPACNSKVLV